MSEPRPTVLVIDDDATNRRLLDATFKAEGFDVVSMVDGETGLAAIEARAPSVVLLDLRMPGLSGIETLARAKKLRAELPVIVLTSDGDISSAVEATKLGAYDFLTRPIQNEKLVLSVRRAIEFNQLSGELASLRRQGALAKLVGESEPIRGVVRQIQQVAGSDLTVLIQGETGTGKELVARAVHQESRRREKPFIALDCGALPETLIEAELFGHEKGAFTGATQKRIGHVQVADGGSLFLDEIGNLSLTTQAKLLRVLQERQVQPIGSGRAVFFDARFIAATNEILDPQSERSVFRQDLYFRLAEFTITLPPLRERRDDVLLLARRFQEETCVELHRAVTEISDAAAALLRDYAWPGNVRELRNVVRQAVLQSSGVRLEAEDVRPLIGRRGAKSARPRAPAPGASLKAVAQAAAAEAEKQAILDALRAARGNKSHAARALEVDFKTLHVKMKRYGIRSGSEPG